MKYFKGLIEALPHLTGKKLEEKIAEYSFIGDDIENLERQMKNADDDWREKKAKIQDKMAEARKRCSHPLTERHGDYDQCLVCGWRDDEDKHVGYDG